VGWIKFIYYYIIAYRFQLYKNPNIRFQFFLQFDRNIGYLGRSCAHVLDIWDSAKMSEKTTKKVKNDYLPICWAHGLDAKNGEKNTKKHIAHLLDAWASYGAILVQKVPSKWVFNFIFYLKKKRLYTPA
jgi:hypothetical protein